MTKARVFRRTTQKRYRLAAAQGNPGALINLGAMYANDRDAPRDYVQAHMWFTLATVQGHENAAKPRDMVEERMTPADVTKAQRLAREWMEKRGK